MKRKTYEGYLKDYRHLNCSVNGNPAYYGWFENENGETLQGRTASDAACGYCFLNSRERKRKIEYHNTRNGNLIIDYITIL